MEDNFRISINNFFSIILSKWKQCAIIILIFVSIGIWYALNSREEFKTFGSILPEIQSKGAGGLGQFAGIASLAGVDLSSLSGASVDAIRPDLYPNVITSTPFYLALFKVTVSTINNDSLSFEEFYNKSIEDGKVISPKLLESHEVREKGLISLRRLDEIRLQDIKKRIQATIDRKTGIITISVKMPDPVVAAKVTKFAMEYLVNYVKIYRTEKLRNDVNYLSDQVASSRGKYYSTQEKKAKYSDQFQDIVLSSADIQRERIESEYRLTSSFYNELLKKYEEAKFKLHQETPVFKILEPPVVPVKRSEPQRKLIVLAFALMGTLLAIIYSLLINSNYKSVIYKVNDTR